MFMQETQKEASSQLLQGNSPVLGRI